MKMHKVVLPDDTANIANRLYANYPQGHIGQDAITLARAVAAAGGLVDQLDEAKRQSRLVLAAIEEAGFVLTTINNKLVMLRCPEPTMVVT